MKRFMKFLMVVLVAGLVSSSANAQLIIKVRPERPHYVKVVSPGPRHVWIDEDWEWRDGNYVWIGNRWVEPEHAGAVWVPGHWKKRPGGWIWIQGHWRW